MLFSYWLRYSLFTCTFITHQIFLLVHNGSIPQLKLVVYLRINIPQYFLDCPCCKKYLRDNERNRLHLTYLIWHYLFLKIHGFPRLMLSENCSLFGTDNVHGQISEHIFTPNGRYCLCIQGSKFIFGFGNTCVTGRCKYLGTLPKS